MSNVSTAEKFTRGSVVAPVFTTFGCDCHSAYSHVWRREGMRGGVRERGIVESKPLDTTGFVSDWRQQCMLLIGNWYVITHQWATADQRPSHAHQITASAHAHKGQRGVNHAPTAQIAVIGTQSKQQWPRQRHLATAGRRSGNSC